MSGEENLPTEQPLVSVSVAPVDAAPATPAKSPLWPSLILALAAVGFASSQVYSQRDALFGTKAASVAGRTKGECCSHSSETATMASSSGGCCASKMMAAAATACSSACPSMAGHAEATACSGGACPSSAAQAETTVAAAEEGLLPIVAEEDEVISASEATAL